MSVQEDLRGLLRMRMLQLLALLMFLGWVVYRAFQLKYCVMDFDIWWHLKVGDWIVEHHAVPHNGIFSYTAADRPWMAYSWGYEVLLSRAYSWFHLLGVGMFGVLLTVAIAFVIFWMLHRLSGNFWQAVLLALATCYAFLFNLMPRPVFFSIIFFSVMLTLLLEANRTGRLRLLYLLPPMFLLWANLHIQFVYGLAVAGLFAVVVVAQFAASRVPVFSAHLRSSSLPAAKVVGIMALCIAATCIGPYSFHLYNVILDYSKPHFTYSMIIELQPLSFTHPSHYMVLLLTAVSFFTLGWRKKIDPFKLALMLLATLVAYRTMRDAWFVCIPAAACIADSSAEESASIASWGTPWEKLGLASALVVLMLLLAPNTNFTGRDLDRAASRKLPVDAANFLRKNPLPGPMYNDFDWGGFLIWYMPQYPVAIDGRNDLYGDDLDRLFFQTGLADNYQNDPYLNRAGFAFVPSNQSLAAALREDSRFEMVYQDGIATIFARR